MRGWIGGATVVVTSVAALCTWSGVAGATVTSAYRHVPLPAGTKYGSLDNVSCASERFCVGVGTVKRGHRHLALIERWNGARWRLMRPAAGGPKAPTELWAADCRSASNCLAVGFANTRRGADSVIERWNGRAWSRVPSPNLKGQANNVITDVSCPSARWCMAAGFAYSGSGPSRMLMEDWNGGRWSLMKTPHFAGVVDNTLLSLDCVSRVSCVAVGNTQSQGSSLILHWNGRSWSMRPLVQELLYGQWDSVFCRSATDCLTAGWVSDGSSGSYTAVERGSGIRWHNVSSASGNIGGLYGVACSRGVAFCVAVGDNLETWTGGRIWSDRALANYSMNGVSCAGHMCIAVGSNNNYDPAPASMLVHDS